MRLNRSAWSVLCGAITLSACANSSVRVDHSRVTLPGDQSYLDTRVVVTPECPLSAPSRPQGARWTAFNRTSLPSTTADNGMGEVAGKVIDLGIDAIANFVAEQARASDATIQAVSSTYAWSSPAKDADPYAGCVTFVHGLLLADPAARGNSDSFSAVWKKNWTTLSRESGTDRALDLPLATDPILYLEAYVVYSHDFSSVSFVPSYFYYGETLDDQGSDEKALSVSFQFLEPVSNSQTASWGKTNIDLPRVEAPIQITAGGFGVKNSAWISFPSSTKPVPPAPSPDASPEEATGTQPGNRRKPTLPAETSAFAASVPAPADQPVADAGREVCLPGRLADQACVTRGNFGSAYSVKGTEGGTRPIALAVVLEEKGKPSPFWSFWATFLGTNKAEIKSGVRGAVLPEKSGEQGRGKDKENGKGEDKDAADN